MATPRTPRRPDEDVRTRTLRVATRLIAERGFEGTSLQDVATEVRRAQALAALPLRLEGGAARGGVRPDARPLERGAAQRFCARPPRARAGSTPSSARWSGSSTRIRTAPGCSCARCSIGRARWRRRSACRCGRGSSRWARTSAGASRPANSHADVDPAAYVVNIITFLVSNHRGAAAAGAAARGAGRAIPGEFVRMARAALFRPTVAPPARPPRRRAKG